MLDPIGGFDRIRDFFISYVETSFRIADRKVARTPPPSRDDECLRDLLLRRARLRYKTHNLRIDRWLRIEGSAFVTTLENPGCIRRTGPFRIVRG